MEPSSPVGVDDIHERHTDNIQDDFTPDKFRLILEQIEPRVALHSDKTDAFLVHITKNFQTHETLLTN